MTGELISKEGYVYWFKLILEPYLKPSTPTNREEAVQLRERLTYFKVLISDDAEKPLNLTSFRLLRSEQAKRTDRGEADAELAIKWAPASMAVIAALKDAYLKKLPVKVVGKVELAYTSMMMMHLGMDVREALTYNRLNSVEIPPMPPYQFVERMTPEIPEAMDSYPRINSEGPGWSEMKMPPYGEDREIRTQERQKTE